MEDEIDYYIKEEESIEEIPNNVIYLNFCHYNWKLEKVILNGNHFKRLGMLYIGINNLENVKEFIIDGFESLINIHIEKGNFNLKDNMEGILQITNCPKLTILVIGDNNFYNYKNVILNGLDNLKWIAIGSHTFTNIEKFEIKGKKYIEMKNK